MKLSAGLLPTRSTYSTSCEIPFSPHLQLFVTELDLRIAHLPASSVDYLKEVMPSVRNDAGEPEYDYERWLDDVFA